MDPRFVLLLIHFFISIKIILQRARCVIPKSHVCGSTSLLQRTKATRDESLVPEPTPLPWRHGTHKSVSWEGEMAQSAKQHMPEVLSLDLLYLQKKLGIVVLCP